MNAQQRDVGRDDAALQDVRQAVADVLFGNRRDGRGVGNAADIEQRGKPQSDGNGDGKIGEDRECKGDQPNRDGGEVQAQDSTDLVPLAHVVSHDKEYRSQRSERDVTGQRRRNHENAEQCERMNHAGDGGARASPNVGGSARDGARGGNAAEQRRNNVGESLSDQLDVGVVAVARHAVGNDGREHAFKRCQHSHGESCGNEGQNVLGVEIGNRKGRKAARNASESAADGFERQVQECADRCAD